MMLKFSAVLVFYLLSVSASVGIQADDASTAAKEAIAKLDGMQGRYKITSNYSPDGGKSWTASPATLVEISPLFEGISMRERPLARASAGFHLETTISYDQYRKLYRVHVLDDNWGIPDIYEGQIDNNKLVVTNLRVDSHYPLQDGQLHFKLFIPLSGDKRQMDIFASTDKGKSWFPNFQVSYEKLPAPDCSASPYGDFDFWLGHWRVTQKDGQLAGYNSISRLADCSLMEAWQSAPGQTGHSLTYFNPATQTWRQLWNSASAEIDISGALNDAGDMVLTGTLHTYKSNIKTGFRGTWKRLENGGVRQHFQQQDPKTGKWITWFDGQYARKAKQSSNS